MPDCVLLLRGINVGGRNRLPMAELRSLAASAGVDDAVTYLQSGNMVGTAGGDAARAATRLAAVIHAETGFEVPVVGRSVATWTAIVAGNPLLGLEDDPKKLHVTFLAAEPDPARTAQLEADAAQWAPERLVVAGAHVYLHCPGGYADTPLQNAFLERRLGTVATTRNWRTVVALAELAGGG